MREPESEARKRRRQEAEEDAESFTRLISEISAVIASHREPGISDATVVPERDALIASNIRADIRLAARAMELMLEVLRRNRELGRVMFDQNASDGFRLTVRR